MQSSICTASKSTENHIPEKDGKEKVGASYQEEKTVGAESRFIVASEDDDAVAEERSKEVRAAEDEVEATAVPEAEEEDSEEASGEADGMTDAGASNNEQEGENILSSAGICWDFGLRPGFLESGGGDQGPKMKLLSQPFTILPYGVDCK